jgi:hypothetical protein
MATASTLASGTSTSSTATLATGATVTAAVGDMLVVFCAADNNGASGVSSTTTCVDSDGVNVYTKQAEILRDPGAAAAGATLSIFTCKVTQALSLDTITVNFSPNTTAKAVQVYLVTPGAGEVVDFWSADATGSAGAPTTHSAPQVSVPSGFIIFAGAAIETNTAITGDSDTTNGSWTGSQTRLANSGSDLTSMTSFTQFKTATATGNQDWACTTAATKDSARSTVIIAVEALRGRYLLDGHTRHPMRLVA